MNKITAIGCDVGNNSVKIKTAKDLYRIDTLVKEPVEARKIFGRGDVGEPANFLDVDIESVTGSRNFTRVFNNIINIYLNISTNAH